MSRRPPVFDPDPSCALWEHSPSQIHRKIRNQPLSKHFKFIRSYQFILLFQEFSSIIFLFTYDQIVDLYPEGLVW
jgi:hypothetical protein